MNTNSRTHKSRGVSLPLEVDERVEKLLEQLRPKVKGFSHYIQLLVDWDLKRKKPEEKEGDDLPFEETQLELVGFSE